MGDNPTSWQELKGIGGPLAARIGRILALNAATPATGLLQSAPPAVAAPQALKIRAVLTDFDGVLGDNDRLMREAYQQLQASHPQGLPGADTALTYAEKPKAFLNEQVCELSDAQKTALFKQGRAIYESKPMYLLPGAEGALQAYKDTRIPLAVVSNNTCTKKHWHDMGLDQICLNIPVYDNAKKPSEKTLAQALAALGQPAGRDVIMIDDNWKGLVAAAKLGITPVYFGEKPNVVLPIVERECKKCGIEMPPIPVIRNQQAMQQMLKSGIIPATATLPHHSLTHSKSMSAS